MTQIDRSLYQIKLYRINNPEYECPWGLRAVKFLQYRGLDFDDIQLCSHGEVAEFRQKHRAAITPQIFLDGERISGYIDLADLELTQIARFVAILRRVKCQITHAKFMSIARRYNCSIGQLVSIYKID
jgi:glutaredoxin